MKVVDRYHDAYLIKCHFEKIMISIEARMGVGAESDSCSKSLAIKLGSGDWLANPSDLRVYSN